MKDLLLLLAMLISATTVFSQLHVSPNGATDSYIFVNDQILFVEQGIDLDANSTGTTEASIYLREQSQLIQGNTATANSGNGFISVMQNTPDDDSWDYSFWGSPVGNVTGTGNQNFGILRLNDSITLTDSNVALTTTAREGIESPLRISTRWTYSYGAGGPWTRIYANNVVTPGYGFIMKGVGTMNHNQIYDFRGRPNNGTMTVSISNGEHTLSGNPYPSALDLNRLFYDTDVNDSDGTMNSGNDEIESFRFWDEDRDIDSHLYTENKGGYGIWTPMGSNPNTANPGMYVAAPFLNYDSGGTASGGQTGVGEYYERRFAPIGQGFQIFGGANGNINIRNSQRRYIVEGVANNSQYRSSDNNTGGGSLDSNLDASSVIVPQTPAPIDNRIPHLRIYTMFDESHFRDMVLAFSDESTDGYDRGFDARHPLNAVGGDVYFPVGEDNNREPYVIQTVPYDQDKIIPFVFKLEQDYTLKIETVEQVNHTGSAYLWDRDEDIYRKITQGSSAYLNLQAGDYENRFFIVFNSKKEADKNSEGTKINEEVRANVDFFQNNPVKQLEISNPEGYTIKSASIYDMSGKLVVNKSNLGNSFNITVGTSNLADGVYLIKLLTSENINIDYKMIIQNK